MARRMIDPQAIIKSQIVDDKEVVDLHEILEKYGIQDESYKTITLQIYNKIATDEAQNYIFNDGESLGCVAFNGSITITKHENDWVYIQGALLDSSDSVSSIIFLEFISGSYENGIELYGSYPFDVHVIKV